MMHSKCTSSSAQPVHFASHAALVAHGEMVYKARMSEDANRQQFAKMLAERLKTARRNAGFPRAIDAVRECGWIRRTYFANEAGSRTPGPDQRRRYAERYGVDEKWLAGKDSAINQLIQKDNKQSTKASPSGGIRRIPLFQGSDICLMLSGDLMPAAKTLPIPEDLQVSDDAFGWSVPSDDYSMTAGASAGGESFPPNTLLVIDPAASIQPGAFVLAMVEGFPNPVLRRYLAPLPDMADDYELGSLNPAFKTIASAKHTACRIVGKAVYAINKL